MEDVNDFKGLNGNIMAFKNEAEDAEKITFIGVPGVCTPFAALFAYAIRDKESHFITLTDIGSCREFEFKSFGMQLNENEISNPKDSDVVVLLGGLAMPKANVDVDELNDLIKDILKDGGKIVGVCYMDMFTNAGWLDKVDFSSIVDGTLTGVVKR